MKTISKVLSIGLLLLASSSALAQQMPKPPFEYLTIDNPKSESLLLRIKAFGKGSPSSDWQVYPIDADARGAVITGTQPFDIVIERPDNSFVYLQKANICNWMAECRKSGKTEYTAPMNFGDTTDDANGKKKYSAKAVQKVTIRANEDTVTIPYYVLAPNYTPKKK